MKIIVMELKKFFVFSVLLFLIAVLFLKYMNYLYTPRTQYDFDTDIYQSYVNEIRSLSFAEQGTWLVAEQQRLYELISKKDEMDSAYITGEIDLETFSAYQTAYMRALTEQPAFDAITHKYMYYQSLEEKGVRTEFYYDLNVCDYINYLAKADYFLIAFVIFTVIQMLSMDREYKMYEMVISSMNGRRHRYKIIAVFLFLFVAFLSTAIVDSFLYFKENLAELLKFKVCNIETFSSCYPSVSIRDYIFFTILLKLAWSILLGYFVFLVYVLTENKIISLVISTAAIYIPLMLKKVLPISVSRYFIGCQLSGDAILTSSVSTSVCFLGCYLVIISTILLLLKRRRL